MMEGVKIKMEPRDFEEEEVMSETGHGTSPPMTIGNDLEHFLKAIKKEPTDGSQAPFSRVIKIEPRAEFDIPSTSSYPNSDMNRYDYANDMNGNGEDDSYDEGLDEGIEPDDMIMNEDYSDSEEDAYNYNDTGDDSDEEPSIMSFPKQSTNRSVSPYRNLLESHKIDVSLMEAQNVREIPVDNHAFFPVTKDANGRPMRLEYEPPKKVQKDATFYCQTPGCGHTFDSKAKMKLHGLQCNGKLMNLHLREMVCPFNTCGMLFSTKEDLYKHKMTHMVRDLSKYNRFQSIYVCSVNKCNKSFEKRDRLFQHYRLAHGRFVCRVRMCGKFFDSDVQLKVHQRIHYDCPVNGCPKMLKYRKSLNHHMLKHNTEFHQCPFKGCSMSFLYKSGVQKHIKLRHWNDITPDMPDPEVEEEKFPCPVPGCGKTYKRKESIKTHQLMCHGTKRSFTCSTIGCGKRFVDKEELVKHQQDMHSTQPVPKIEYTQPKPKIENIQPKPKLENAQPKPKVGNTQPKPKIENTQPKLILNKLDMQSSKLVIKDDKLRRRLASPPMVSVKYEQSTLTQSPKCYGKRRAGESSCSEATADEPTDSKKSLLLLTSPRKTPRRWKRSEDGDDEHDDDFKLPYHCRNKRKKNATKTEEVEEIPESNYSNKLRDRKETFACDVDGCNAVFSRKQGLKYHKLNVHKCHDWY